MQLFHVPIIQPDLRHEDTVIQAANALNHLQHVIDSVFDRIDARIDRNASRIAGIQQRLDAANRLGQQLVGKRSAAVRIVSPAEYPIASRCADVPMTFGVAATAAISSTSEMDQHYAEGYNKIRSSAPERWSQHQNTRSQAEDKLQFYHVKRNPPAAASSYNSDGLGERVPTFVDAVDGVLLHNTGENVYADYKNAAAAKLRKRALAEKTTGGHSVGIRIENNGLMDDLLGAAPPSISNRSRSQQQHRGRNDADESLFYAPSSSEAPIIEVPLDLPDLPGIALNVELSVAGRPNTITTGNTTTAALLSDLPDLPELLAVDASKSDAADERNARHVVGVANVLATPPLPPPPPPPPLPPQPSSVDVPDVMTSSGVVSAVPTLPPPPPPPPPPAPSSLPEIQTPAVPVADDRSNLMAAIRQAAGKKTLRTASMQETTSEKKVHESSLSSLVNTNFLTIPHRIFPLIGLTKNPCHIRWQSYG